MPNPQGQDVRVALLYQSNHLGGHLRDALKELGAAVVYEALSADIDRDALEGSGARVVIVNLDADSDAHIDHVYDMLDEGDYQVVFNDAQVSSNLSGWDHARWARNLAAKILSRPEIATPPRPLGAESVPTPVQKSASGVPIAEKPGEQAAPLVAAPQAPPAATAPSEQVIRRSEAPTVELPLPVIVPDVAAPEPVAETGGLDIAALSEFAQLIEPVPAEPEYAELKPSVVVPDASQGAADFAAELDALFAAADGAKTATPEYDIDLPPDETPRPAAGDAKMAELEAIDIPFDVGAAEPGPAFAAEDVAAELHVEFPAIFDQLDAAAVAIPAASDGTFKPAERTAEPVGSAAPALPPEWNLELVDDEAAASVPTGPAKFGIEKVAAEDYLAPQVDAPTAKQTPAMPELGGMSLELMPMEEAIAPTYSNPGYSSEAWLDGSRPATKLKVGTGAGIERVFVLGASIGGPEAVRDFLGALPAGFPMLFILAQHMGEEFLELMSAQLAKAVALTVRNPTHGERVGQGEILVVPTTHRMQVDAEGVITLAHLPEKAQYSPSIDQVLRDVADQFGAKAGTIIFSGMAHDAIEGSKYLKSKGGVIWVQDPDTCVISSMVDGAREAGVVSFMGSPKQLAEKMIADYGKS
ncbi:MAG: chemotaxis protein CheB [Rudaea sp.]|nr:chemotaxis protein CheB [Rudaea sp.]